MRHDISSFLEIDQPSQRRNLPLGNDESTIDVEIHRQIDNALGQEVVAARKAVHELGEPQREVAALSRAAAKDLAESGLSSADIAVVLGVSPQRVYQLLHG